MNEPLRKKRPKNMYERAALRRKKAEESGETRTIANMFRDSLRNVSGSPYGPKKKPITPTQKKTGSEKALSPPIDPTEKNKLAVNKDKQTIIENEQRIKTAREAGNNYWAAFGEKERAAAKTAKPKMQAPGQPANTFTQTGTDLRAMKQGSTNSSGISTGGGTDGAFRPRDTTLGRQQLGMPTRAQTNANRRQRTGRPTSGQTLRSGQTRLNLPAANAEKMRARDIERLYEKQRRRSAGEGAVIGDRNARSFDSMMRNITSEANTGTMANVSLRGHDVTSRGQDLNYDSQLRGQEVTARGQDISAETSRYSTDANTMTSLRSQDVQKYGIDVGADTAYRDQNVRLQGQNSLSQTAMRNTDVRQEGANYRSDQANKTSLTGYGMQVDSAKYTADLKNNAATLRQSNNELEGFAYNRKTGETDKAQAARYMSVRQDMLRNGLNITNSEQIVQVSNFFDELNANLGDSTNFITAANFADPENQAKIIDLGLMDQLLSFNLGSPKQLSIPGVGFIPNDEIDSPLDYETTQQFNLRGRGRY